MRMRAVFLLVAMGLVVLFVGCVGLDKDMARRVDNLEKEIAALKQRIVSADDFDGGMAGVIQRRRKDCANNLKQIGVAIMIYQDRYDAFPVGTSTVFFDRLRIGVPDVVRDELFVCPMKGDKAEPFICSYRGPGTLISWTTPLNSIIAADKCTNHGPDGDVNVLFFDGHVECAPRNSTLWNQVNCETQ